MGKSGWIKTGVVFVVALMAGACGKAYAALEPQWAEVAKLNGQVEWLQAGTAAWKAAQASQKLSAGDKVRTGNNGSTTLSLAEGSTIRLESGSELLIQTLGQDPKTKSYQYFFGISRGKLAATVSPVTAGSKVQFQTPLATVDVPAEGADPTVNISINPDGSVTISTSGGTIHTIRDTTPVFRTTLENGEQVMVIFNPATQSIRVADLAGTFDVTGPNGQTITLNLNDSVLFEGTAATFIPGGPGVDAPAGDRFSEPASTS